MTTGWPRRLRIQVTSRPELLAQSGLFFDYPQAAASAEGVRGRMPDAIDIEQIIATALAHHEAGQRDLAEAGYRAVLQHDPDEPDALNLLGLILQGRGDLDQSIALITRALDVQPDFPEALTNLARAQRLARAPAAAADAARRAIALDPDLAEAHLQLGGALMDLDDNAGAVEALRRATGLAPRSLEAQVAFATALTRAKDLSPAAEAWQAALALKPDDPGLLIDLAESLGDLGRLDEALAAFRQADALAPDDPRTQCGLALCLLRTGEIQAAAEVCRRAVETTADQPRLWVLLASCEAKLGHFDAATGFHRRALALAPGSVVVLRDLVAAGEGLDDAAAKDAVRTVLDDQSRVVGDRVAAGFALGQSCDRQGAYDEAFAAYAVANRLLRADGAAHGVVFDRNAVHDLVDRLIATIGPQSFADTAGWGDPSELPVFIVGMPRSGTSLVEQIAASHPLVFGAGERKDIEDILAVLGRGRPTVSPVAWDLPSMRRETMAHVRRLRGLGDNAVRVIDKNPLNVMFLGQIAMLFPRARIVVCRRDARDVCLSCFFQHFGDAAMTWTNDLADCALRARETDRLMQHWRKVLPLAMLEIHYETLVGNLAVESRRLIDFLGLEWHPACLSFHETERTVLTASYWQVRQPLYGSSVGRWRHYRHHLGPLLRELEGVVPADDEDPVPEADATIARGAS
jgi:tetratricopeptide (TPR) repeat protein